MALETEGMMETVTILQGILEHIDDNLSEDLSPERLAARAGFSTWHFCRVFRWGTGYAPMAYVRLRRLAFAAYALHTEQKIIDISLEYGFETHSGFSKAFRRYFGCPPEIYRLHAQCPLPAAPNLILSNKYSIGGIFMEPRITALPARKIAGYTLHIPNEGNENSKAIPAFWHAYMTDGRCEKLHRQSFVKNHAEHGACFPADPETGTFDYAIGVEVPEGAAVPAEYDVREIPAATYAVFSTPPCNNANFTAAIQGVWQFIFNEWFPASGYEYARGGVDFELYDERCMTENAKICDIYIPVAKK